MAIGSAMISWIHQEGPEQQLQHKTKIWAS